MNQLLFAIGAVLCSAALTGCGGIEGDLLDALDVPEQRPLCLSPGVLGIDAFESRDGKRYLAKAGEVSFFEARSSFNALDALRSNGYASEEATSLPKTFASSFDAYEITDKGNAYFKPDQFTSALRACVGEKVATEILEYTEPGEGNQAYTQARFAYELEFNDLIDDLDIEDAIRQDLGNNWPGHGEAVFVKTNNGWRLEHAGWQ